MPAFLRPFGRSRLAGAWLSPSPTPTPPAGDGALLVESGGVELLEGGGRTLLQGTPTPTPPSGGGDVRLEDGGAELLESGYAQVLEGTATPEGPATGDVRLESGGSTLLEDGGDALLEGTATPASGDLRLEDGGGTLLEGGGDVLLEGQGRPTVTLREAIATWLVSLPGLSGIGVYFGPPSQLSAYPCVALKIPSRSYGHNLYGADGTSRATVEITALSLRQSECVAMAESIRDHAHGFRGDRFGVAILRMIFDDEADDQTEPPDGSDQWIYQITLEYRCDHRVPAPTNATQTNV